ncbi:MAG: GTP cyclohydrolase II [Xanthomonadaceae bacterium]|nr:GTP cyclohydrolase II [Xanthomonadaceae bacterium]
MTENRLKYSSIAKLPTEVGEFKACCVLEPGSDKEHLLIYQGKLENAEELIFRIHSECMTSEVFGSLKCDCRDQLKLAMKAIADQGRGAILYLRQEGRGIGLFNKIEAYSLQDLGFNTIDANLELGLGVDLREYDVAAAVLKDFGVKSIRLASNNPLKIKAMETLGITIAERVPVKSRVNAHNKSYLQIKRELMDHAI